MALYDMPRQASPRMTIDLPRPGYQSVTERLSSRLDALEPVVQRLLANEAKLIADSVTAQAELQHLVDVTQALHGDIERSERGWCTANTATFMALDAFRARTCWQRLRWLVTGR